ncbi:conserved protein of unknown function; putative membrane protein [Bradyrhizobium sp. ORS 285]|uniref:hypothetical protein n=1 Tax=Bradyrhizobium sp. ORS 285 TaxID=115808 RepID=UPI0002407DC9|nr:hypothetical protein [Bradyrhizobium sp. ORS 285]CCD83827.1 conserved hypothetical protein; putative membrane protein [Bradyrhizobium sp. ORS 285]SMX59370.1 conserved protein of unknown function; putative membrane protein [Bradyrhizobium sp. ORS 285]
MQANQDPMQRKPVTPRPVLATAVLVTFLILHIVAVAILRGADTRDGAPPKPVATLQSFD